MKTTIALIAAACALSGLAAPAATATPATDSICGADGAYPTAALISRDTGAQPGTWNETTHRNVTDDLFATVDPETWEAIPAAFDARVIIPADDVQEYSTAGTTQPLVRHYWAVLTDGSLVDYSISGQPPFAPTTTSRVLAKGYGSVTAMTMSKKHLYTLGTDDRLVRRTLQDGAAPSGPVTVQTGVSYRTLTFSHTNLIGEDALYATTPEGKLLQINVAPSGAARVTVLRSYGYAGVRAISVGACLKPASGYASPVIMRQRPVMFAFDSGWVSVWSDPQSMDASMSDWTRLPSFTLNSPQVFGSQPTSTRYVRVAL